MKMMTREHKKRKEVDRGNSKRWIRVNKEYIKAMVPYPNQWADDLPHDVIKLIMAKLFIADQASFLATCTSWRLKHDIPPPPKQLPFMFRMNYYPAPGQNDFIHTEPPSLCEYCKYFIDLHWRFQIYDPTYKRSVYTFCDTSSLKVFDKNRLVRSSGIQAWAYKGGWLLISASDKLKHGTSVLFFYNPFSRNQIQLPKFHGLTKTHWITCTSSPTSSNCMVLVVCRCKGFQAVNISMCHPSDETWTTITNVSCMLRHPSSRMVYLDGTCYWILSALRESRVLTALHLSEKTSSVHELPEYHLFFPLVHVSIVESNGELLLVYNSHFLSGGEILIFKLVDRGLQEMNWVRVYTLGNQALFIQEKFSLTFEVPESKAIGGIGADGVYYVNNQVFYFLKDQKFFAPSIYPSWKSMPPYMMFNVFIEPPALP